MKRKGATRTTARKAGKAAKGKAVRASAAGRVRKRAKAAIPAKGQRGKASAAAKAKRERAATAGKGRAGGTGQPAPRIQAPSAKPAPRMLRIALTGGIATGKSYVLQQFRQRGVPCLDADLLAHGVIAAGTEATIAIAGRFGREMLGPDGAVDRRRLGQVVFADQSARRELEAIVHPAIFRAITAGLHAFEMIGHYPMGVVDIPLLYETGRHTDFDQVIVTTCAPAVQMARLLERGMSPLQAQQRLAAQWPAAEKTARADIVIATDGSFADTDRQVERAYNALRSRSHG
ncbi:MAG TPA: dephospho-CoA kinase [Vicinamibacterales bacterium]|nr:dephospho-CoA kinase [Vicinamibacterales bacterium]